MSQSGVVGVVCADSKGLCLGGVTVTSFIFEQFIITFCSVLTARGNGSAQAAGHITTLADKARELAPYGSDPVIVLESPGW